MDREIRLIHGEWRIIIYYTIDAKKYMFNLYRYNMLMHSCLVSTKEDGLAYADELLELLKNSRDENEIKYILTEKTRIM